MENRNSYHTWRIEKSRIQEGLKIIRKELVNYKKNIFLKKKLIMYEFGSIGDDIE